MDRFFGFAKKQIKNAMPDLAGYSKATFAKDLAAGITVGIVALPLSLALAIATGVPPILGLYTAGVAGFLAAFFSGSPYSVSGPAAAMVPILAAIIQAHGLEELPYIGILAAVFLLFFAFIGVGKLIRKVPESVVLGFTCGVAVVIFVSQLNSFLGLTGIVPHDEFAGKLLATLTHLTTANWPTVLIGLLTLGIIVFWSRVPLVGKVPPTLIAVVMAALLVVSVPFFGDVATLKSAYGDLPLGFPAFNLAPLAPDHLLHSELWLPALEIAGLIAIESLLCAVVADKLTKSRHRPSQELMAQGIANIGSALFGGIPATGVIARTGTIIKSGARSRIASIIHALIVISFIVALAPLAASIPLTALSAVLLVTAVKIAELREVTHFVRSKSWRLSTVLAVTMVLTIFTDLVTGVGAGLVLHLAFAMHNRLRGARNQDGPLRLSEEEA